MATELTDEEAAATKRLFDIVRAIGNNPDARKHFERSLKVLDPKISTSDDVVESVRAPLQEQIDAMRKERDEERAAAAEQAKKDAEESALARLTDSFGRLREQGLTDDGETKVRELMKERGIYDPEAAFALFEKQNPRPTAEQSAWVPDRWQSPVDGMPNAKEWFQDEDRAADDAIGKILAEERKRGLDA
jgi:hypothetical protein